MDMQDGKIQFLDLNMVISFIKTAYYKIIKIFSIDYVDLAVTVRECLIKSIFEMFVVKIDAVFPKQVLVQMIDLIHFWNGPIRNLKFLDRLMNQ